MTAPFRLGEFLLESPLGRGGVGEVWRATHVGTGLPVAIKVLTCSRAHRTGIHRAFSDEARAVAGLHHPGIVWVFEHGQVPDAAAEASGGRLAGGSPFLAMELADGGTLADGPALTEFDDLRAILGSLLSALGHAHARGVLHLDLKPANVLRCGPTQARPGLKLTDFGLARLGVSDSAPDSGGLAAGGTPQYMAPEQLEGRSRDFGPWTDLFALGCVAFELACGEPPAPGRSSARVLYAQMAGVRRPFAPRLEVPAGFADWIEALLAQDPAARFHRAADAAWALEHLPESPRPDRVPPLPRSWQLGVPQPLPPSLAGVGLGLWGLRQLPVVGREAHQDRLWTTLEQVGAGDGPRAVVLEGSAGCGKTRLAAWFAELAHEHGAASVLRASFTPEPRPHEGLAALAARLLRCTALDGAAAVARVRATLALLGLLDDEAPALARLAGAEDVGDGEAEQAPAERYSLLARLLVALACRRPVLVWLEDVHWSVDGLYFARHLLATSEARGLPVALVLTARSEALAEAPTAAGLLREVEALPGAARLELGPLPERFRQDFVGGLLGLEAGLAARVAARTAGNPLFAVQIVGDWVQRGVLAPGEHGFTLAAGATEHLPDDVHDVWRGRLEEVVAGLPETAGSALELAAVLGEDVDPTEWAGVCSSSGSLASGRLTERLLQRRLAVPTGSGGWRFANAMLRESVLRKAEEGGRLEEHHRACAGWLGSRTEAACEERTGLHLLGAGDASAGIDLLLRAAETRLLREEPRSAEALCARAQRALDGLLAAEADPRAAELLLLRCQAARAVGRLDEAARLADAGLEAGERAAVGRCRARLLLERGRLEAQTGGDHERVLALLGEACYQAQAAGATRTLIRARRTLANHWLRRGEVARAERLLQRALQERDPGAYQREVADLLMLLGDTRHLQGNLEEAERHLRDAFQVYGAIGWRRGLLLAGIRRGDVARATGDLPAATQLYREALEAGERIGSGDAVFAELNLALVQLELGEHREAHDLLQRARRKLEDQGRTPLVGAVHAFLLPCLAGIGDWPGWDRHLAAAAEGLAGSGFVDRDVATQTAAGGDLAEQAGEPERARAAWALARDVWLRLEVPDEAARLAARL